MYCTKITSFADRLRRKCLLVTLLCLILIFGIISEARSGEEVALGSHVSITTSNESSTLNRFTRVETSTADVKITNTSDRTILFPLHAVIDIQNAPYQDVEMPDALGGYGEGPYGKYYYEWNAPQIPGAATAFGQVGCHDQCAYDLDKDGDVDGRDLALISRGDKLRPGESLTFRIKFMRPSGIDFTYNVSCYGILSEENIPPVADAGENRTYTLAPGQRQIQVHLDGTASSDTDGTISQYIWTGSPDPEDTAQPVLNLSAGTYVFTLVVVDDDGVQSPPDQVTIIVQETGAQEVHPPVLTIDSTSYSVDEGSSISFEVSASDEDGQMVVISASPKLENASFSSTPGIQATGTFTFDPDYEQQGIYVVLFTARDPSGLTDAKAVQITVNNINRPPTLTVPESIDVDEGDLITIPVRATDPDGELLTLTASPLPDNAVFIPATGTITFAPDFDQAGTYDIECKASDGKEDVTSQIHITVRDVSGGTGESHQLILSVNPVETPTLLTSARISGTVNANQNPATSKITSALITSIDPANARQGDNLVITIIGKNEGNFATHFSQATSVVDFGGGVTVNSVTVNTQNEIVANITVSPDAEVGTRAVTVKTDNETAISVMGFNIEKGRCVLRGIVLDQDTGQPIIGAIVTIQGTNLSTRTNSDGSFSFQDAPPGEHLILVNSENHELFTLSVTNEVGVPTDVGTVKVMSTVFDPSAPPSISLHSILNRGANDLTGAISLEDASKVIEDTMVYVGGTEVGVLDAYGNQLNPNVQGVGKLSLLHDGVRLYSERLAKGESISLLELFMDMRFAFTWNGQTPTFIEMLNAMQNIVNQAWANVNDPNYRVPIILFNQGKNLNPNPPVLNADTRLNRFQAYLAISGFMAAIYNHRDEWAANNSPEFKHDFFASLEKAGRYIESIFETGPAFAQDPPGIYTITWENFIQQFNGNPTGPSSSEISGEEHTLPDFEDLLRKYYLDESDEALSEARAILKQELSGYGAVMDKYFDENPYSLKAALRELITISASDIGLRNHLHSITSRDGSGTPSQNNLWSHVDVQMGGVWEHYFGYINEPLLAARILQKSLAPSPPYIYKSEDCSISIGSPDGEILIPAVKISFYPSGSDSRDKNQENVVYIYRLWRVESAESPDKANDVGSLKMVGWGKLDDSDYLAPKKDDDPDARNSGRYMFKVPLPPRGMNHYRIDCIRFTGDKTVLSTISPDDFQNSLKPWLAGYLDEPGTITRPIGLNKRKLFPGQGTLQGYQYEISHLSNVSSVYISGQAAGLGSFGRIDMAADRIDPSKIYISIPGFHTDEHGDRGTGSIFRYDPVTAELSEFVRPGFMIPGQVGLAIDSNSNLYTENGASETAYGGRIFRILGYRNPDEPPYVPAYPNPNPQDPDLARTGEPPTRLFVGSVNYYSRMLMRALPTSIQQIRMGNSRERGGVDVGEELYVADMQLKEIRRISIQAPERLNWDPWHNVAERWAWNTQDSSLAPEDKLNFNSLTDIAFDTTRTRMFVSQGPYVLEVEAGADNTRSITRNGTIFVSTAGLDVCESNGEEYLFVSDRNQGGTTGRIFRIPLKDIPIEVPSDEISRQNLIYKYLFLEGLDHPGVLRITENNGSMALIDNSGFRLIRFGFTGRALDSNDNPLIGAVVKIRTLQGEITTTTDSNGYYNIKGLRRTYDVYATIVSPTTTYTERITLSCNCHSSLEPHPCVIITEPANGGITTSETITVRGLIFPEDMDFSASGGHLLVTNASGAIHSYELHFTTNNEFEVSGVSLGIGDNTLIAVANPTGILESGGSLTTRIRRTTGSVLYQAVAGVALDSNGNSLPGATVHIFVDGAEKAEVRADSCAYYNAMNLPLGQVTVTIEQ